MRENLRAENCKFEDQKQYFIVEKLARDGLHNYLRNF